MKFSISFLILIFGGLCSKAEIGVLTTGKDVTAEDETSKVTPEQDVGANKKDTIPLLGKIPIPSVESLADVLPGKAIPSSSGDDNDIDFDELPFENNNIEEGQKVLEDKCRELGGEEAVISAKDAKDRLMECAGSMVNVTKLQGEIDDNKSNGELDTVFKKYCRKVPQFKECLANFTQAIDPCLKEEEKTTKEFIHNVTDAMLGFICYKEGDRIALFIAEGGPECFTEKQHDVQNCLNSTLSKHLPKKMPEAQDLPAFVLEEAQCLDINNLQTCVVKSLESCKEPTPANIVESMMNYLKKSSPCAKYLKDNGSGSFVNPLAQTILSTFIVLIVLTFQ